MTLIAGHTFADLSDRDKADLKNYSQRGLRLVEQVGKVCAFDYLTRNIDRFPVGGLAGRNPGNLMISDDVVVCIDNNTCRLRMASDPTAKSSYDRRLARILADVSGVGDTLNANAEEDLRRIERFFPTELNMRWALMRTAFLAGFRLGIDAIATLTVDDLQVAISEARGNDCLDPALQQSLYDNLAQFRRARVMFAGPL